MGKLITVFWRDIPSHIIFKTKSGKFKKQMSPRFEKAIDRAAMRAGKGSSDAYMADWRREIVKIKTDDPQSIVDQEIELLEQMFSDDLLEKTVKSKGIKEE
ncbi:MAG: hypothetical protein CMQ73_06575 [Gammaproteobacteria bacterium]|nr:hypothetical protein [Gammaproteobacteria bacterium]OUT93184.1 MAG: hypothetical protein CBB96_08595 [Gammaproteobacteria bacterium TMED36]|tara:strand:- start:185 stop:487 length:303 start_codon:yes stop_codon:yes gene_type:complete